MHMHTHLNWQHKFICIVIFSHAGSFILALNNAILTWCNIFYAQYSINIFLSFTYQQHDCLPYLVPSKL